ncbi:MAG: VWA domain-containing protein [Nodosilinea sp.]
MRITPPAVTLATTRAPLNLSLVLDRSGSMRGQKMSYARQAACFAIENLLPCDRISVVLFDDRIETLVPSTLATDKNALLEKVRHVHSRGSTALHAGWVGGVQASQYLNPDQLNRVVVLSDGLANVGESRPDAIANDVHRTQTEETTRRPVYPFKMPVLPWPAWPLLQRCLKSRRFCQ